LLLAVGLVAVFVEDRTARHPSSRAASVPIQSSVSQSRALLIGISDYDRGTNPDDAFGSLNTGPDLANMNYVLKTFYAFAEANIHVLRNESATQENIVREFKQHLVDKAKPGDRIVIYYTGHGHFVPDVSGDETADHFDEVLVTWVPKQKQSLPKNKRHALMYMLDDTYELLLQQLSQKMRDSAGNVRGSITVIFDSCHSGSATKDILVPKGRPWNDQIDGPLPKFARTSEVAGGWLSHKKDQLRGIIFISACRSDELSYMMPDSEKKGSILTYYLTQFLTDLARREISGVTYEDLYRSISGKASSQQAAQDPQIEGNLNTLLFGDGKPVIRQSLPRVQAVKPGRPLRLELDVGSLHGVTKGSRFDIYKSGKAVNDPANKLAEMEVTDTSSITSLGMVTKSMPPSLPPAAFEAAQAVVTEYRFDGQPLKVLIQTKSPSDKEKVLQRAVAPLRFVAKNTGKLKDYDVTLGWEKSKYFYRRANGDTTSLSSNLDTVALQKRLLAAWRWRRLANLTLPGPPKVHIDLVGADGKQLKRTEGGRIVLKPGDHAQVTCRNDSGSPIFITVIHLKASGEIETFPSAEVVNMQQALSADDIPRHLFDFIDITAPHGPEVEILKIIATPRPTDFSGMAYSEGQRNVKTRGPKNPLEEVLLGLRDSQARDSNIQTRELDQWYTDQVVYEIRPK
jgi:hypothetical protein